MKKFIFCLLILLTVLSMDSFAKSKKKKLLPPPTRGSITAISLKGRSISLTLSGEAAPITYAINELTTVEIDDKASTLSKIQTKMEVRSVRLSSGYPQVVEDVDLVSAQKAKSP